MSKKPVKTEDSHPLEGLITVIYLDPQTRKEKEGRARIIHVLGWKPVTKTQDVFDVIVHFIGDRRGYDVQRQIVMRRASV